MGLKNVVEHILAVGTGGGQQVGVEGQGLDILLQGGVLGDHEGNIDVEEVDRTDDV